jgi:NAD(P)H dehydrogenase (quinone)
MVKVLVAFYSTYGHIYKMAQAVAEGAKEVAGAEVDLKRVPETLPTEVLEKMHAVEAQKAFAHVPIADPKDLGSYDLILLGSPTRFGNMAAQMKSFLDATGGLWMQGSLVGKVGGAFTSTASQHGGNETTQLSFATFFLHQGMVVTGLPYSFQGQMKLDEITGGTPYGASTIAAGDGSRQPSENELDGARFQGKFAAGIAAKLAAR